MFKEFLLLTTLFFGLAVPTMGETVKNGRELAYLRLYFEMNEPYVLYGAQTLMNDAGAYQGKPDGKWGPKTEAAFLFLLQTYIAIGGNGPDWGVNSPQDAERFLKWVTEAGHASASGGEFPD